MATVRPPRISCINWLDEGPLSPHGEAYKQYLIDRACAASTFGNCLGGVAHFVQWLGQRRMRVRHIDEAAVAEFLNEHLPRCGCAEAKLYRKPASAATVVAALRAYFRYRATLGDAVHRLIGALSYPASWRLASLPKTLTSEEIRELIGSLGQAGRSLRRADAIVPSLRRFRATPVSPFAAPIL